MNTTSNQKGYLLISILLAILILGLLVGGVYMNRVKQAKETRDSSEKQIEHIEKHLQQQTKGLETQIKSFEEKNLQP
jgi:uncharacterized protein HemX